MTTTTGLDAAWCTFDLAVADAARSAAAADSERDLAQRLAIHGAAIRAVGSAIDAWLEAEAIAGLAAHSA